MARRTKRPPVTRQVHLRPERRHCSACGGSVWAAYENYRTVTTLDAVCRLTLTVVRCHNPACPRFRISYRPEEEGAWSLPHHEFGLDVIARIGRLRYREHRSIPEIHQVLHDQGVAIAQRTVSDLLARYEELLAVRLADHSRLIERLTDQGHAILAIDGLQPHKSGDVLWVIRDCLSGEVLLARSLDSMRAADLAELLREVKGALPVPIHAVVSDAQKPIRLAVQEVLPGVPHQLCHFHYLKEVAKPITAADSAAKTDLKKYVRGVRDIERSVATRNDTEAEVVRDYCLAVRSALADDGKPPLVLPGLVLHDRLQAIQDSLDRVLEKRGGQVSWSGCVQPWNLACLPPRAGGNRCARLPAGSSAWQRCWRTRRARTGQRWRQRCVGCSWTS
jgi:hypothetical protein